MNKFSSENTPKVKNFKEFQTGSIPNKIFTEKTSNIEIFHTKFSKKNFRLKYTKNTNF